MILGIQYLSTLGTISQDYRKMKMDFRIVGGKRVVLTGMTTNAPMNASKQHMGMVLGHGGMHSTIVRESQPVMRRQSYEGISKQRQWAHGTVHSGTSSVTDSVCTFMVGSIPVEVITGKARPSVNDLGRRFMVGGRLVEDVTWSESHIRQSLGQRLLEEKQFWEGRTIMSLSK